MNRLDLVVGDDARRFERQLRLGERQLRNLRILRIRPAAATAGMMTGFIVDESHGIST